MRVTERRVVMGEQEKHVPHLVDPADLGVNREHEARWCCLLRPPSQPQPLQCLDEQRLRPPSRDTVDPGEAADDALVAVAKEVGKAGISPRHGLHVRMRGTRAVKRQMWASLPSCTL